MDLKIGFDQKQLADVEKLLDHIPRGAERACSRALNRTTTGVRTQATRSIRDIYVIKAGDVRETMRVDKATPNKLRARLVSRGAVLGLQHFSYSPKNPNQRPKIGVRIRVRKASSAKPIAGTFLISGKTGIFQRKGKERFPLERKSGPAVPSMMKTAVDERGLQEKAEERLARELEHEVDYLLKGKL